MLVILFILLFFVFCGESPDEIKRNLKFNKEDFANRLRETSKEVKELPSDQRKHMIFLVDTSGSMNKKKACEKLKPTLESIANHFMDVENSFFTLITFSGTNSENVILDHLPYPEAREKLLKTSFSCGGGTPMKGAFDFARKKILKDDFTLSFLLTDGQSTDGIEKTREAAELLKKDLKHLFAAGFGDATENELKVMCSGDDFYRYFSEIRVLLKLMEESFEILKKEIKEREIVVFDVTKFSFKTVPNTSSTIPFHIRFTLESGKYENEYLDFRVEEIEVDANEGLDFFNPGGLQSLRAVRKRDSKIHYEVTFYGEPKNTDPDNMIGVPYDLRVKSLNPQVIFKRNLLEFSVSAYTEYFDEGITILPLGAGEVGKSLWIQTMHITHSTETKWKNVDYGGYKEDRTMEILPFCMARDGFFGNINTYIDIFGMEIYEEEFLRKLINGWIPSGYSKEDYEKETFLDIIKEPEWDDPKRMKKVDAVAYFLKDEQVLDDDAMKNAENAIDILRGIDKNIPIIFIISCHQTHSCPEEDLKGKGKIKERISRFSDYPIFDLNPYVKLENSSSRPRKKPRKDKNQWRINEALLQQTKDDREKKIDEFCRENPAIGGEIGICKYLKNHKQYEISEKDKLLRKTKEHKKNEFFLYCMKSAEECRIEYDNFEIKRYCDSNSGICEYPSWKNLFYEDYERENQKGYEMTLPRKVMEKRKLNRRLYLLKCIKDHDFCFNEHDKYRKRMEYCKDNEYGYDLCIFFENPETEKYWYQEKYSAELIKENGLFACSTFLEEGDDECKNVYEDYLIRKGCKENPNFCSCFNDWDGADENVVLEKQKRKEFILCLEDVNKCLERCSTTQWCEEDPERCECLANPEEGNFYWVAQKYRIDKLLLNVKDSAALRIFMCSVSENEDLRKYCDAYECPSTSSPNQEVRNWVLSRNINFIALPLALVLSILYCKYIRKPTPPKEKKKKEKEEEEKEEVGQEDAEDS